MIAEFHYGRGVKDSTYDRGNYSVQVKIYDPKRHVWFKSDIFYPISLNRKPKHNPLRIPLHFYKKFCGNERICALRDSNIRKLDHNVYAGIHSVAFNKVFELVQEERRYLIPSYHDFITEGAQVFEQNIRWGPNHIEIVDGQIGWCWNDSKTIYDPTWFTPEGRWVNHQYEYLAREG